MATPPANQPDLQDDAHANALVVEIGTTQGFLKVDVRRLAGLARRVLAGEGVARATVSIALVDDQTIHRINRDHLGHDWPTDVITFPLSQPGEPELAGELVVSAEMARATAHSLGADPHLELALYLVHGLLHLCGYKDGSDLEARMMHERENLVLEREGLASTYSLAEPAPAPGPAQEQPAWSG